MCFFYKVFSVDSPMDPAALKSISDPISEHLDLVAERIQDKPICIDSVSFKFDRPDYNSQLSFRLYGGK